MNSELDEFYKNNPMEALKADALLEIPALIPEQKEEITQEKLEEFQKYNRLFNTNRKFRKAVYAQRFSRTSIKPSLK
jgi:hypothetical protein